MRRRTPLAWQAGFTLVELMIATVVLGILIGGAGAVFNTLPKLRLSSATRQVVGDLQAARRLAIKRNHDVVVAFANYHQYTIWTDTTPNGVLDAGEVVKKSSDLHDRYRDVTLTASDTFPWHLTFNSRGGADLSPLIIVANATAFKEIRVITTGKVTVN